MTKQGSPAPIHRSRTLIRASDAALIADAPIPCAAARTRLSPGVPPGAGGVAHLGDSFPHALGAAAIDVASPLGGHPPAKLPVGRAASHRAPAPGLRAHHEPGPPPRPAV